MRSRKIILSMAMAGVLLTGCASVNNQNEVAGQTPEITTEATEAETETEGKVVMSKEQTDEFIMNRIWEESWLKGYGKILYPDFEMSYYYYPGYNYDFRSLKTDDGISVVDKIDSLEINFNNDDDVSKWDIVTVPVNDSLATVDMYKGSRTPRLLYRDANGDGVKDVIVRMNSFYSGMMEQIDNNCYCVIVDGKTHKAVELSAKDYFKKFDDVTSVTGKKVSDDNLEIRVSLSGGEEVIDNIEINENTEIGDIRLNSENQYIYFGEDGPYVGFWVTAYAQYTDNYRELISLLVKNKLVYNSTDNSYELGDEFVIDPDLKGLNGISEYSEIPAEEIQKILNAM